MESDRIKELEKQNEDLHIRLRALEYAFMLSVVSIPPELCKIITEGFGPLQEDILRNMTDAEARENVKVNDQLQVLLRHVFAQGRK